MKLLVLLLLFIHSSNAFSSYPAHWWQVVADSDRQGSWEVLPHECKKGELVLSKRNELGVFSNFAHTPFVLDGVQYTSIEGLWQMMKYPDHTDSKDIRNNFATEYLFTCLQVMTMFGFEAKQAGNAAKVINKKYHTNWVSYRHQKFNYKDYATGSKIHLRIMQRATRAKLIQNPNVYRLLLKTKGLKLIPDHEQGKNQPPSYLYHKILMDIRDEANIIHPENKSFVHSIFY